MARALADVLAGLAPAEDGAVADPGSGPRWRTCGWPSWPAGTATPGTGTGSWPGVALAPWQDRLEQPEEVTALLDWLKD